MKPNRSASRGVVIAIPCAVALWAAIITLII